MSETMAAGEAAALRSKPEGITLAQIGDEDEIFDHLLQLHEENGIFTVDELRVRDFIRQATERQGGLIAVIRGEEVEASIGLVLDQWWYTLDWCWSERWCFVNPKYRRKNHARRLVEYGKWVADNTNLDGSVVPLQMGIISSTRTEAKERLYRRQLKPVGGYFMYKGKTDAPITGGAKGKTDGPITGIKGKG